MEEKQAYLTTDTKRSSLKIIHPGIFELWDSFVLKEIPLEFPYYDDSA